jgi:hypothetical protein
MNKSFIIDDGTLVKYNGNQANVVIPDVVTEIGADAFLKNDYIKEVYLHDGILEIGNYAFESCKQLETVHLSEGIIKIGFEAFCGCKNLRSLVLPKSLRAIRGSAFESCINLEKVTIFSENLVMSNRVFMACDKLADENGFIVVKDMLFDYIGQEEHVTIPDGVVIIGGSCFASNKTVKTILCPSSTTTIQDFAFIACNNLESITMPHNLAEIGDSELEAYDKLTIYAPAGSFAEQYAKEKNIKFEAI